ncbi:hypothetical protein IMG5_167640 [Ichthyophthirius multifiliis]|uniref:Uncharacterized protein n=1 Tax=Ichthyophthirius multifiliis TaxID=5932 RepID=G0R0Z0_ICHMU|nr:hypothetical protein IMG5_167640 [Ichthyophthirius multifiliis]EGR28855.1 hypothetical protein IMG5_167640 [Ichthyophthirius multifiliis]|eukprot:XP_004030091.1 hypothetical protein IMG5_167640 [Ichthyophthirius multifiliis]
MIILRKVGDQDFGYQNVYQIRNAKLQVNYQENLIFLFINGKMVYPHQQQEMQIELDQIRSWNPNKRKWIFLIVQQMVYGQKYEYSIRQQYDILLRQFKKNKTQVKIKNVF